MKSYVTSDLLFGDSGKGAIVDSLVRKHNIDWNIRYSGGHQAAHNVVLPDGTHHTFSQFGAGSFKQGVKTILTKDVIFGPVKLINEGMVLINKGLVDVFKNIYIHEDCLVTTPYHQTLNQIREIHRGNKNHGSCGAGIGETAAYALKFPNMALRVKDLLDYKTVIYKLIYLIEYCMSEICDMESYEILKTDKYKDIFNKMYLTPDTIYLEFKYAASHFRNNIVNEQFILDVLRNNPVVFEASQGTLLDEDYGFHPYTTWSKVTAANAKDYLKRAGVTDYETIGVMRTYASRHGAGPFPTECSELTKSIPELHNGVGRFQGGFRMGHLDMELINYAIDVNYGIDSLAITHCDVSIGSAHKVSIGYENPLRIFDPNNFLEREEQTNWLKTAQPKYISVGKENLFREIKRLTRKPITIASYGTTHLDKQFL